MYNYPVYKPDLTGNERKYVLDCIDSTWISSKGKYVERFERQFAEYLGTKHAVSVCNGTAALHTALLALGIGPADEIIVPSLTYVASANAITYTGALPVFADSDPDSWQIDPKDVTKRISPKTKAIMAVHLYGHPCAMDELQEVAEAHNLILIEDCAEALGSEYQNRLVGNFGSVSCFSFYGNKTITTGEGGMIVTDSNDLQAKLRRIKGQGLASNREYWHDIVGYNYRMTNIQAAIGCAQLERINDIIGRKIAIAHRYRKNLKKVPIDFHQTPRGLKHTYWMCCMLTREGTDRESLREYLRCQGIETRPLFFPVHTMPIYKGREGDFPSAENLGRRGICLPSYPQLSDDDVDLISDQIIRYYRSRNDG